MYCQECGNELPDGAKFCPGCGRPAAQAGPDQPVPPQAMQATDEPLLVLKPQILPFGYMLVKLLPVGLFFAFFCGMFCGVPGAILGALLRNMPFLAPGVVGVVLGAVGVPTAAYLLLRKNYEKTEYRFYADHLEYYEGLFNIEQKSIQYRRVAEVNLVRGVFQKRVGRGSLYLATPATGLEASAARSGITLRDIENPEAIYEQVKALVASAGNTQ